MHHTTTKRLCSARLPFLLMLPMMLCIVQPLQAFAGSGESAYPTLPSSLAQRVNQHLQNPWQVGERPHAIVVVEPEAESPLPYGMLSPEARRPYAAPAMDADFEKKRMLFFAQALAMGFQAFYFREAFQDRDNGTVTNYGGAQSDLFLALCLSYWLSDALLLNANLGWTQERSVNRFAEEDRRIDRTSLAVLTLGVGYYYSCFGPFGLLAEAEIGGGIGGTATRIISPLIDPITTSLNAWSLQASAHVGLFFAMHRWMVFARMGAMNYSLVSQALNEDFVAGRNYNSTFNVGLNLKQIAIGMRFLLNYSGQQERYAE